MATESELPVEGRLYQLLQELGIPRAHFAARGIGDWNDFATIHSEHVSSLTLVCPRGIEPDTLRALAHRLLVLEGDQGQPAEITRRVMANLPEATLVTLDDYFSPNIYADVVAEQAEHLGPAMMDFLALMDRKGEPKDSTSLVW